MTPPTAPLGSWSPPDVLSGALPVLLALLVGVAALYFHRFPQRLRRAFRVLTPPLRALRAVHSGHLGDYVVWLLLGVTLLTIGIAARGLGYPRGLGYLSAG